MFVKSAKAAIASGLLLLFSAVSSSTFAAVKIGAPSEPPIELFALVLGGIGIFLIGIHFAGDHLQQITSGSFQSAIKRISGNPFGMMVSGLSLGFLTQSGKATAFILSDFVQVDLIKARLSASIVYWGNAGSSLIVFASMLSVKVVALCLLGVTALGITFSVPKKLVHAYGALFGLAMVMFGLYLVKTGAAGFAGMPSVPHFLDALRGYFVLSFALGFALTLLVQSNIAIMMIMIAMASAGLFALPESAMAILGAQAGSGLLTYTFSFHSKGRARQTIITQISFDVIATLIFVIIFYVEIIVGLPVILSLVESLTHDVGTQVMIFALCFQFVGATILVLFRAPVFDFIESRFPPSAVEVLAQPEFLHSRASESPETGLLLVEKEQFRLLNRMPAYFEYVRQGGVLDGNTTPGNLHAAFLQISSAIGTSLADISSQGLSSSISEELIKVTKTHEQLVHLEGTVFQMSERLSKQSQETRAGKLGFNIMESLDFMLLTAIDAIDTRDDDEIKTLSLLTQDRAELMARLRHDYFQTEAELSQEDRNFILDITILFENAVQTLSRYGVILKTA